MKILMVCLGNICRSPMADGLMREIVKERGIDAEIDSAGTSAYHIGEAPDERMIRTAKQKKIDIEYLRARQFTVEDFTEFDLIFAMDRENLKNILKLSNDSNRHKVRLILNEIYPDEDREVPDPYFGGSSGFDQVYDLLNKACNRIADKIESGAYR